MRTATITSAAEHFVTSLGGWVFAGCALPNLPQRFPDIGFVAGPDVIGINVLHPASETATAPARIRQLAQGR
jgi:hypothetical protein